MHHLGGHGGAKTQVDEIYAVGPGQRVDCVRDIRIACSGLWSREYPRSKEFTPWGDTSVMACVCRSSPNDPGHMGSMGVDVTRFVRWQHLTVNERSNRNRVREIGMRPQSRVGNADPNSVACSQIECVQTERLMPPAHRSAPWKPWAVDHLPQASAADNHRPIAAERRHDGHRRLMAKGDLE
jgi:hypothetical protein